MNYKVLYRKYRPNDFNGIVGQDYIISILKNSIINNKISHAYIFSGPRGTGKTSTAKVFAKAINCMNPIDGSPCGKCEACLNFNESPDIIEMDAASNNGVDEIREIIDNIKLSPAMNKYKVYIIDEVHMLTTSAFNALLLTLEEPPSHVVFILATTNIESVPITILSRCQRFDFQKINSDVITDNLKVICKKEKIAIEEEALAEIAYISEGGMRDALSLLDQLSKNNDKITLSLLENEIRIISQSGIAELIDTIESNDVDKFLKLINDYQSRAIDYKTLIKKLINSLSIKAKNIKKTGKYDRLNFNECKSLIMNLSDCLSKINVNVNPFIIIEMVILEFFNTKNDIKVEHLPLIEKEAPQKNIEEPKKVIKKSDDTDLCDIRINNCFVNAKKSYLEDIKNKMSICFENYDDDGKIKAIVIDSTVVAASDQYIVLNSNTEKLAVSANKMLDKIEKIFNKEVNGNYKMIFISDKKWNAEKEKYISNIKNGYKYKFMVENTTPIIDETIDVSDVFDKSKVEII
jgi:DNA polymerase-3 subunit gamma/tau